MEAEYRDFLNNDITLSEFLVDCIGQDAKELKFDAKAEEITFIAKDSQFKTPGFEVITDENEDPMEDKLIPLKDEWNSLLKDGGCFGDLYNFIGNYKIDLIDIDFNNKEVKIDSNKEKLLLAL